jgi:hypothetical protein
MFISNHRSLCAEPYPWYALSKVWHLLPTSIADDHAGSFVVSERPINLGGCLIDKGSAASAGALGLGSKGPCYKAVQTSIHPAI